MVFSSLEFIFIFLPLFLLAYGFSPPKMKNSIILLGSLVFYYLGVGGKIYVELFIMTLVVNFILGQFIESFRKTSRLWLTIGIIFNFWWLIFFKYYSFAFESVNTIFHTHILVKNIVLPIGISFYTFQNVSYIIDVYRKKARAEKNLINYGAYISMFPQLIAGPIVTYTTVAQQLRHRKHTAKKVEDGLKTFTIGLGYKMILANHFGILWKNVHDIGYESVSPKLAWLAIFAYSFQLYFDFCGYSLMAIGLGRLMGFELPKNFDYPYLSTTMTEFWRRWHITLGTWFREYIYIPLGGNRKGPGKQIRNMFAVWLFTGLWHGASWNFVLWGLVLFAIMMSEKFVTGKFLTKVKPIGHLYMIFLIPLTWSLFVLTDFHEMGIFLKRLFPFLPQKTFAVKADDYVKYWQLYGKYFIAAVIFSTRIPEMIYKKIKNSVFCAIVLAVIFWLSVYCMYTGLNNPFMYYQF